MFLSQLPFPLLAVPPVAPAELQPVSFYRSERESLESSLFEVQQQLILMESRREQLETDNQNLRVRSETAAGKYANLKTTIS